MAIEVKAPALYDKQAKKCRAIVFLGGVIDQGSAPDWQKQINDALKPYDDVLLLNPRRDEWDASWEQSISNPQFKEQVVWELDAQTDATLRIYVFAPDEESAKTAKAPITLLELGLFARGIVYVVCPKNYYRKGNVDIVCERYDIPLFETMEELIEKLHEVLKK